MTVVAVKGPSDLFGGTRGNPQGSLPLGGEGTGGGGAAPNITPSNLPYDEPKMEKYLLDRDHPKGGSKAKFLEEVLGYTNGDGKALHDNIVSALSGKEPSKTTATEHGIKYEYEIKLPSRDNPNTTANVTVVVQQDNGSDSYRIITLVPRKKD